MSRTQVRVDDRWEAILGSQRCQRARQRLDGLTARVFQGLPQEVLLGTEMRIEAAMGEPGARHDVFEADARDAAGAELCRGGFHDLLPCSCFVLPWPGHRRPLQKMLIVIKCTSFSARVGTNRLDGTNRSPLRSV